MRKHVKEIGKFFIFIAIFFSLTSPFVVLFGPFDNLKRTVVGAILKSRHPQYITWLFTQQEIDEILGGISSTPKQELFNFKARTDTTLTLKISIPADLRASCWKSPIPIACRLRRRKIWMKKAIRRAALPNASVP